MLSHFSNTQWNEPTTEELKQRALTQLEQGNILYFNALPFTLTEDEKNFLTPACADPTSKNIGYDATKNKLWGVQQLSDERHQQLKNMLARYSSYSYDLIKNMLPHYLPHLMLGRTSFRPVQITGRQSSYRKDDKRLHVDAFPSSPNQGKRILRVFCNINPNGEDRVWRTGESFDAVATRFIPVISNPIPLLASTLRFLKITKSYRTPYDHYMLHMHDKMKADLDYQQSAEQREIRFPPGSAWIVQTDHVSHAAMTGQHLLEQTFYLPVQAMHNERLSPLRILENMLQKQLA